jgi:hypothetical protein
MSSHNEIENKVKEKFDKLNGIKFNSIIDLLDVEVAVKNLAPNKAIGYDGIGSEFYKNGEKTALILVIKWIFDQMFSYGIIPSEFNVSVITPIPKKKGYSNNPADYRPISVSTTLSLIFEDLVRQKINLCSSKNQFGFKKATSTKHAYFVVNETLQYYKKGRGSCWVASLDANKAFDRLWRYGLFFKLDGKILDIIWRLLYLYYLKSEGVIKINNIMSMKFIIKQGVKQGGIISPFLFNFYINDLIEECLGLEIGARIGRINVCIVAYCDDIILISPIANHLKILLDQCSKFSGLWKIKFNAEKSAIYTNSDKKENKEEKFYILGKQIDYVNEFIYLGLPIGDRLYVNGYWENKFKAVEKAFFSIRNIGLHNEYMDPMCLSFIFRQYCQSIFQYGLELITINRQTLKQFETRQNMLIKNFLKLSKFS